MIANINYSSFYSLIGRRNLQTSLLSDFCLPLHSSTCQHLYDFQCPQVTQEQRHKMEEMNYLSQENILRTCSGSESMIHLSWCILPYLKLELLTRITRSIYSHHYHESTYSQSLLELDYFNTKWILLFWIRRLFRANIPTFQILYIGMITA